MTPSDIKKYLSDVPSDLLIDCLVDAALASDEVFKDFDEYALIDPTKCRIFIRGLNYETDKESLSAAFAEKFDCVIADSTVIFDKSSGKSKGYGFITFGNSIQAANACRLDSLEIDGRRTQISLATPLRSR